MNHSDPFSPPVFSAPLSSMPPYEPDDDQAAATFVSRALRHPHNQVWNALLSQPYVRSTDRVLRSTQENLHLEFTRRRNQIRVARAERWPRPEIDTLVADHADWKIAARHFQEVVQSKLVIAKGRVRDHDRETLIDSYRDTLLALVGALAHHRSEVEVGRGSSAADRLLWARLDSMWWPSVSNEVTLAAYLAAHDAPPAG